ncbi:MAG: BrnT family toxin [Nostoc sp.]
MNEQREIIIGHSQQNLLLLISFTERSNVIRIISARLATRKEREDYERNAYQKNRKILTTSFRLSIASIIRRQSPIALLPAVERNN